MIKNNCNLSEAKEKINSFRDKEIEVTVNLGRNKAVSYCGTLSGIYPALFTVRPSEKDYKGKTSYSYSEYLCGTVKIKTIS